ncbi:hypothetical protein LTS16_014584 [Friedmanniomyces endolithicus]|nr:hypothetical protein LTS16_014584 [Friedmanniomyces endolithicus]
MALRRSILIYCARHQLFALPLTLARTITIPWLKDMEKDMRERGIWEQPQEDSMRARGHEDRPESGLLLRIGSALWECIRTSGSSSDGSRTRKKDVLLRRLYDSVLRSVAEADEEIARLERLLGGTHPVGGIAPPIGRGCDAGVSDCLPRGPGNAMRPKQKIAVRSAEGSWAPPAREPVHSYNNEARIPPPTSGPPSVAQQKSRTNESTKGDRGLPTPNRTGGKDRSRRIFQEVPKREIPGKHDGVPYGAGLYQEHGYGSTPETNPAYAWKPPENGDEDDDDTASHVSRVTRAPTMLSQESAPIPVNVGGSARKRSGKKKGSRSQR